MQDGVQAVEDFIPRMWGTCDCRDGVSVAGVLHPHVCGEHALKYPANWLKFLQENARAGDEHALAVLRSRKVEVQPIQRAQER